MDEMIKILVDRVPEYPRECPLCKHFHCEDWNRMDCSILSYRYPMSLKYFRDDRLRRVVEKKVSCRLALGEECPYLKTV